MPRRIRVRRVAIIGASWLIAHVFLCLRMHGHDFLDERDK